jgi:hypothetical protein
MNGVVAEVGAELADDDDDESSLLNSSLLIDEYCSPISNNKM